MTRVKFGVWIGNLEAPNDHSNLAEFYLLQPGPCTRARVCMFVRVCFHNAMAVANDVQNTR